VLERLFLGALGAWPVPELDDEPWHRPGLPVAFGEPVRWAVPSTLSDGQLLAETEKLSTLQQRLRVLQLPRLREMANRQLFEQGGFHGTKGWLAHTAPDADHRDVALARRLEERSHLQRAVAASSVSVRAARKVAEQLAKVERYLDSPDELLDGQPGEPLVAQVVHNVIDLVSPAGGGRQRDRVEQAFVLLAEKLDPQHLVAALDQEVGAILPNLLEREQEAAEQRRGATLEQRPDGSWDLKARLTPECGERLHTGLAAEARRDPANPVDTRAREQARAEQAAAEGREQFTDGEPRPRWEKEEAFGRRDDEPLVPRTRSRRLHDALDRLLERYLGAGLGGSHDTVPVQMAVTLSSDLVDGVPGALPARGPSGRPLARSLIRRWWCDSHVTALVMSRGWIPLGLAHTGRTLRRLERRASLVQQDRRCIGMDCCPGEPDPLIPLVPHHVWKFADHGRTSIEETLWVCPRLHHDLHTGKRTVRLRDGRLVNEDGWITDESSRP